MLGRSNSFIAVVFTRTRREGGWVAEGEEHFGFNARSHNSLCATARGLLCARCSRTDPGNIVCVQVFTVDSKGDQGRKLLSWEAPAPVDI